MVVFLALLGLFVLVVFLLSGFSSAENLVFSLSADDIRELSLREDSGSRWLSEKLRKPREFSLLFIVVRTLLITIVAIFLFLFAGMFPEWWFAVICAVIFWASIILFGFAFPNAIIRGNKLEKIPGRLPLMRFAGYLLAPANLFWRWVLRILVPEGGIGGPLAIEREIDDLIPDDEGFAGLETEEKEMIRHVVEFGDTTVREVMLPRIDMVSIPEETTPEEAIRVITSCGHSRIPLYRERIDDVVGILYAKDLLLAMSGSEPMTCLGDIAREPYFVPEAKKTADLLRKFKSDRIHIAVVVDEYGGTAGLVTIEDLLEEIVGEIQDEYDAEETPINKLSDNVYLVDAKLPIDEVNEELGIDLPEEDVETLAGFIYELAEAIPKPGDKFPFGNLLLIVESVDRQRIKYVKVVKKDPEEEIRNGKI